MKDLYWSLSSYPMYVTVNSFLDQINYKTSMVTENAFGNVPINDNSQYDFTI